MSHHSLNYNPYYDKRYRKRDDDSKEWTYNIDGTIKYKDESEDIDKLNKEDIIQIAKKELHNDDNNDRIRKRKEENIEELNERDTNKKQKSSQDHNSHSPRSHSYNSHSRSRNRCGSDSHHHHHHDNYEIRLHSNDSHNQKEYENKYIWSRSVDEVFFSKKGHSKILIGTEEYYDFKDFFKKYNELRLKKLKSENKLPRFNSRDERERDEHKNVKIALTLFADFKEKKLKSVKEKIKKVRDSLPIKAYEDDIIDAVKKNKVILIAGDTGCGKSTQVVQYLLESGFNKIACTQPRRIACSSLARRVTYETHNIYGSEIAYQVRFDSSTKSSRTKVLFLTEGVLIRQFSSDPLLSNYDVIIIDEIHERHVTGDFLLEMLKQVIRRREDIRLILMSATINIELFSNYFNAPTIKVPGKVYPVKVEYMPIAEEDRIFSGDKLKELRENNKIMSIPAKPIRLNADPYLKIMERIDQSIPSNERGDLLIFQSGINEITKLAEELKLYANYTKKWIILQLHSTLSAEEQDKVFAVAPEGVRKCIISTNIAETSVTIDGIRFIIDSGRVKEMGYDIECGVSKLSEYWISKASAMQRMGRAGRTGPGECFRFYSENEFENLNDFAIPEIKRIPLESIILQIGAFNLGNPKDFDFIEKPPIENIIHSIQHLKNINALDYNERLTPLGKMLSNMPIDVSLGKMLIMAMFMGFSNELIDPVLTIISGLSIQSPFVRVNESKTDILNNKHKFDSDEGDTFTILNLFSQWLEIKAKRKESSRMWCRRHGVEEQRLYEMVKLKSQFQDILEDCLSILEEKEEEDAMDGIDKRFNHQGVTLNNMREYYDHHRSKNDSNYHHHHRNHHQRQNDIKLSFEERKERKAYREFLRRQKCIQKSQKKRVILKLEEDSDNEEKEEEPNTLSLHEIEFELNHDANLLQEYSDISNLSSSDINLLKIIMCCGLYPNLAISDSANPMRKDNEQIFHTKNKSFIYMHPTSIYYSKPELLHTKSEEIIKRNENGEDDDNTESKPTTLQSLRNEMVITELLCYQSLLETQKPYLVNVVRVPALQACLLFSKKIDTNLDLTRIVVDDWLLLSFTDQKEAEKSLILSNWLRLAWELTINQTLEKLLLKKEHQPSFQNNKEKKDDLEDLSDCILPVSIKKIRKDWEKIQCHQHLMDDEHSNIEADDVTRLLIEFMNMKVDCKVTKPTSNEISAMFPFSLPEDTIKNEKDINTSSSNQPSSLPGIQITPYLRYGSLPLNVQVIQKSKRKMVGNKESTVHNYSNRKFYSPPDPYLKQYWKCGWCNDFDGVLERSEAIAHLKQCSYYQENLAYIKNLGKKAKKKFDKGASTTTTTEKEKLGENENRKMEDDNDVKMTSNSDDHKSSLIAQPLSSTTTTSTDEEKKYFCSNCQQSIVIRTPADILRHRKVCSKK
ncbi:P-loop containing nucleoside triphosphate hydrolase protein [Piromyces finnis]|uniref:p-loop containing nucleoside triphosphate hydrolase protein n=1 Tax=Piromyces finnis TaxID=1754191 RepID=A0A1Y1V2I2_9FUNG|nr:P-loop containing nucleoside triphosphate hydrolase protein [Piromyces finnis]|eukprot:ORX45022.1 P-loop containing nucleoside triphosphate hydrolase protein [Piromyces finnis]